MDRFAFHPRLDNAVIIRWPRRALDHVLVSASLEVRRRMAVPVLVSDHLPVMAELAPRAKVTAH